MKRAGRPVSGSYAPTATTDGRAAGQNGRLLRLLPAAATTTRSRVTAATARARASGSRSWRV
ncbi:hypothetical protein GCM10025868_02190 [Angustibacter aerolatus]|uniref:Uncharacterized protein n=1 Tax=Angustibacter aerolatus TaxID=1162965 RepID=A0ABQ6JBZ2_9ACTN|nr:hypothetical protein GCM10025868_02190 [Angustibacter aerolatus]